MKSPFNVTIKHMRRKPVTLLYPFEKLELPDNYRGIHHLDDEKCSGCGICATICPGKAIKIVQFGGKKRPSIDYGKCMFCGLCVEFCTKNALTHTHYYEFVGEKRNALVYGPEKLIKAKEKGEALKEDLVWKRAKEK
ncbi:MAG: NADH-quinone oxidoreductase subunit I [Candidatus Thermoplasmatota archaeon]